jgi:hypothetical protein
VSDARDPVRHAGHRVNLGPVPLARRHGALRDGAVVLGVNRDLGCGLVDLDLVHVVVGVGEVVNVVEGRHVGHELGVGVVGVERHGRAKDDLADELLVGGDHVGTDQLVSAEHFGPQLEQFVVRRQQVRNVRQPPPEVKLKLEERRQVEGGVESSVAAQLDLSHPELDEHEQGCGDAVHDKQGAKEDGADAQLERPRDGSQRHDAEGLLGRGRVPEEGLRVWDGQNFGLRDTVDFGGSRSTRNFVRQ